MKDGLLHVHTTETLGTHEGPGVRTVFFLQGCELRCLYCHNPEMQTPYTHTSVKAWRVDDVVAYVERYRVRGGGVTFSGGEPTLQAKALIGVCEALRERGVHTALDTSGAIYTKYAKRLYDIVDLVLLDVKHIDTHFHKRLTGVGNEATLATARYLEEIGREMWLRYVLVPGITNVDEHLRAWARYFSAFSTVTRVEILPFHTLGMEKYHALGVRYPLQGVPTPSVRQLRHVTRVFGRYMKGKKVIVR